jgi:hypothetical protein
MSKETYKLTWLQSTSSIANEQEVDAFINGVPTVIGTGLVMTVGSVSFDFDTNAQVEWFVKTFNADKSKHAESVHATFVATNEEPLAAATNLASNWFTHIP